MGHAEATSEQPEQIADEERDVKASGGQLRRKAWDKNPTPTPGRIHFKNTKTRLFCTQHQRLQTVTDVVGGVVTLECGCQREQAA